MEAEFQLTLKRFPAPSVSSLIRSELAPGRASGHQNLFHILMDRQLSDRLNETILKIEVSLKDGCLLLFNPSLHARMPDVSYLCVMSQTLNGDDDDECIFFYEIRLLHV